MRIYGDGSALDRVISGPVTLADTNLQYNNFAVEAGAVLTVASGTVIRCTGTFTNNGTIIVETFARGGFGLGDDSTDFGAIAPASEGLSARAAGQGEFGDATQVRSGGSGGMGLKEFEARAILMPGLNGGGGGAASDDDGASGGGTFVVLARGAIVNNGGIHADGQSALNAGSGGGGGGVIILASTASATNPGTLTAKGGNGENSDNNEAPSAGGGGGIIHMLAPSVPATGTRLVDGGLPGSILGPVTVSPARAGAGGGASGGNGGTGGDIQTDQSVTAATSGFVGYTFVTIIDPTSLF